MTDQVGIYNMALSRIGASTRITALNEQGNEVRVCNLWYEQCRDECLRDFPWSFATKAIALAESLDTYPGWENVYAYPSDALTIRSIVPAGNARSTLSYLLSYPELMGSMPQRYPWQVVTAADEDTRNILIDLDQAWAIYTVRLTNIQAFPPDFTSLVAWKLASEIALPLQAKADFSDRAIRMYEYQKGTTAANSLNEQQGDALPDSPSITARG